MFRRFLNLGLAVFLGGILFIGNPLLGDEAEVEFIDAGVVTYDVDTEGPRLGGDYYASGNDDAFGEYGITTFNFNPSNFGGPIANILEIALTLTVHDRDYADGGTVEFFFSPYSGPQLDGGGGDFSSLVFDRDFDNGINVAQFPSAPMSLGTFDVEATNADRAGEQDTFILSFEGAALADLINAINNGLDFQIIIAAATLDTDVTYAGVNNNFGLDSPTLGITVEGVAVPEPGSAAVLTILGLVALGRRKKN